MNRRHFLLGAALAGGAVALPVGTALLRRRSLLEEPQTWVGSVFETGAGARLKLVRVEELRRDQYTVQSRLQFAPVAGDAPQDGTQALRCGAVRETLFMQAGREGPVACVNRLRTLA